MGERTIPWCCEVFGRTFKNHFEREEPDGLSRDRRGFFVTCRQLQGGPLFMIAHRAAEAEMGMKFCPWCGAELARHYAGHLDVLSDMQ
jgi:hypothetical protein